MTNEKIDKLKSLYDHRVNDTSKPIVNKKNRSKRKAKDNQAKYKSLRTDRSQEQNRSAFTTSVFAAYNTIF